MRAMSHRDIRAILILSAIPLAACGSASTTTTASEEHHEAHAGDEAHAEHEHDLPAELAALHDVLAPVWHADAGATRASLACTQAAELATRSAAVNTMLTPEPVDGLPWSQATARLVAASDALTSECAASGPEVETRLSSLHDEFHGLVELLHDAEARDTDPHSTDELVTQ